MLVSSLEPGLYIRPWPGWAQANIGPNSPIIALYRPKYPYNSPVQAHIGPYRPQKAYIRAPEAWARLAWAGWAGPGPGQALEGYLGLIHGY